MIRTGFKTDPEARLEFVKDDDLSWATFTDAWPKDMVITMKSMWVDGYSSAEIGARIGKSRSAVAGQLHRLGLSHLAVLRNESRSLVVASYRAKSTDRRQASQERRYTRQRIVRVREEAMAKKTEKPPVPEVGPFNEHSTPLHLREAGQCAWPLGKVGDVHYSCGAPTGHDGGRNHVYCPTHRTMMFEPRKASRTPEELAGFDRTRGQKF